MAISEGFARGLFTTIFVWFGGLPQHRIEALLALIGMPYLLLRGRRAALPVIWMFAYFAAYSALGVTAYYWYYAPLVPGFIVLVGLGVTALAQATCWLAGKVMTQGVPKTLANVVIVVLVGLLALLQMQYAPVTASRPDARFAIYRATGEWLNSNTPVDSKAGLLEVGIVGFYSHRSLVDFAGLIQPEVSGQMRSDTTYDDTAIYAARTMLPDYVLLLSGTLGRFHETLVKQNCTLTATLPGEQYNFPNNMEIYKCDWQNAAS